MTRDPRSEPRPGDVVLINGEDWRIKAVFWDRDAIHRERPSVPCEYTQTSLNAYFKWARNAQVIKREETNDET